MSRTARLVLLALHLLVLTTGALFSWIAVAVALESIDRGDPSRLIASKAAQAAVALAVTVAFGATLIRRGFTPLAPVLLTVAYIGIVVVGAHSSAITKGFAPAPPEDVPALYSSAIAYIATAIVAALLSWIWTHRYSRFPLF